MKRVQLMCSAVGMLLLMASPVLAQAPSNSSFVLSGASIGAGLGAALTIIGAGYGFGRIGSSALEGMARQPEAAGRILPAMIVIAALLEGATFFALLVCYQMVAKIAAPGGTPGGSW